MRPYLFPIVTITLLSSGTAYGNEPAKTTEYPDSMSSEATELNEVIISTTKRGVIKPKTSALNVEILSGAELKRAACCNLAESFTTNPSVDVNYTDAATGAKQIKLLGLPGTYVLMLTENAPNLRGAAAQYGLSYIPGPWMQSIQVSKGASSVKNGYESVTGQINVEYLKPQTQEGLSVNAYVDHMARAEANFTGNVHLSDKLSTGLLLHAENSFTSHDNNDDSFADAPKVRQFSAMNRWAYFSDKYIFQGGIKYIGEKRESGQRGHHSEHLSNPYLIDISTHRGEGFLKNAYFFDREHNGNVALLLSGSLHDQKSAFGHRIYNVFQKNLYGSLMLERDFGPWSSLSAGLSINMDHYQQKYRFIANEEMPLSSLTEQETTPGIYVQYTYNYDSRLLLMGGVRYDHSSRFGSMFTPRLHGRWNIVPELSVHLSAGKGYRSPFVLADFSYLLASSRRIVIDSDIRQEEAWNFGGGLSGDFYLFGKLLNWNLEYYYTDFRNQCVADLDASGNQAHIMNIHGKSYSHSAQVELTYRLISDLSITGAYRYNDVRVDYGRGIVEKPLTSKSKGLISMSYTPMMGIWQFDLTAAFTGSGRMPNPYTTDNGMSWNPRYKAYTTLNAQITRYFRKWSIYIGGENLTNTRQKTPIIGATDPWGSNFDATMIYAPIQGAMIYAGFRFNLTK